MREVIEKLKNIQINLEDDYKNYEMNNIDSLISDIENRKCENCKYNKKQDNFMIFCDKEMCQDNSKMMWHSFTKDFCCKYWESK